MTHVMKTQSKPCQMVWGIETITKTESSAFIDEDSTLTANRISYYQLPSKSKTQTVPLIIILN